MATMLSGSVLLVNLRRAILCSDEAVTDGQLLEAYIATRDEAAFESLLHRHGRMVFGVCRRVLGDTPDVEDAFQATFLVLVRKAPSIVPRHLVGNWLYGVAHRTATSAKIMTARRRAKERATVKPESQADDPASDLWPVLDQELSLLPDKYRTPIVLCDLEGRTQKEAARQLGCPEGTISTRLRAARSMLAKALTRRGVSLSGAALVSLLAQGVASAGVPPGVMSSTMRFATLIAAGRAAAGGVSAGVLVLTEGVLKTMLISKLKTALVVVLAFAVFGSAGVLLADRAADASGRDGGGTSASPGERVASRNAPVPKAKPDPGLIWVYNKRSGALTAYTPDGQKAKELKIEDRDRFLGFTPDGQKMASVGTVPGSPITTTLHLRDMNDNTEGTDTGFPVSVGDWLNWSADGKRVIRERYAFGSGYSHTHYDLGTKKETELDIPANHQVYGLVPDGEWLLTVECRQNRGGDVYKVPLGKGKPTALSNGELNLIGARLSPDRRSVICFGSREKIPAGEKFVTGVYSLDIKSGAVTKVAQNDEQNWSKGFWSPDGTRVAYFWAAMNTAQPHHLVVCDKDGKDSKALCTIKDDVQSVDLVGWYPSR